MGEAQSSETLPDAQDRLATFAELLSTCQSQLLASVYAMVQNTADAEDICQRASLTLWRKFDSFEVGTDFRAWAMTITRYEALNFMRKRTAERAFFSEAVLAALAESEAEVEKQAEARESRWHQLTACLDKLPTRQRKLIELYYSGTQKIESIAAAVGSTDGAVRTALCRARQSLRRCVQISERSA